METSISQSILSSTEALRKISAFEEHIPTVRSYQQEEQKDETIIRHRRET